MHKFLVLICFLISGSFIQAETKQFHFDYYGMDLSIPEVNFEISKSIETDKDARTHWTKMNTQNGGILTANKLSALAKQMNLNGYLTFRLAERYMAQRFPDSNISARMSGVHFMMTKMGYDAKLSQYKDVFLVMLPFKQEKIINMPCHKDVNGRNYYILFPEDYNPGKEVPKRVITCPLPRLKNGKVSDLKITGLNLPFKGKSFEMSVGNLTLKGDVNENIKEILRKYPQMPFGDVASSWIDQSLRDSLVNQVKRQVAGMSKTEAVNSLLRFLQYGYVYMSDKVWNVDDKANLLEENFLYNHNDCEDRAIFLSFFIWNALNLPCQLLRYPQHVNVGVALDEEIEGGAFYEDKGIKYYFAEPTVKGASVGVQLDYCLDNEFTIEKHYK